MAKYIINVPDKWVDITNGLHIPIETGWDVGDFRIDTGLKLTPYNEPSQKAIDLQHAHDIENVARMNYSKGAEDAWEFVREIYKDDGLTDKDLQECFGYDLFTTAIMNLSYQEMKAKFDAWKAEREQIRVGDEVEICGTIGIVTRVPYLDEERVHYIAKSGTAYCNNSYAEIKKTGRHFGEIEELLKKIGGES